MLKLLRRHKTLKIDDLKDEFGKYIQCSGKERNYCASNGCQLSKKKTNKKRC